jgi:hypothetical protein
VAGIVEQAGVRALEPGRELVDLVQHGGLVEVDGLDHVEVEPAQGLGDGLGVVGQVGRVLVGAVADDQCHAATSIGMSGERNAQTERQRRRDPR